MSGAVNAPQAAADRMAFRRFVCEEAFQVEAAMALDGAVKPGLAAALGLSHRVRVRSEPWPRLRLMVERGW